MFVLPYLWIEWYEGKETVTDSDELHR